MSINLPRVKFANQILPQGKTRKFVLSDFNKKTNKLETFEDALFKGSKTSTNKTEKLDAPMRKSVCGKGQKLVIFEWIMS